MASVARWVLPMAVALCFLALHASAFTSVSPFLGSRSALKMRLSPRRVETAVSARKLNLSMVEHRPAHGLPEKIKSTALAMFAVFALLVASPDDALAARSGGRASGSFRRSAPAPTRTYSAPSSSARESGGSSGFFGSSSGSRTVILAPSPSPIVVSPFGYSPFGLFSPFNMFRPMIVGPALTDLVLIGGVAYVGYKFFEAAQNQKFITGAQTVAKLQVAVYCDDRSPSSLIGTIKRLVDKTDTSSQESMAGLVSDVALALLRRESSWVSAAVETSTSYNDKAADDAFTQFSLKERSKIERETVNRVNGKDRSERSEAVAKMGGRGGSTVAVVTLILCLDGKSVPQVKDRQTLKEALLTLGSDTLPNESVIAAEVTWTPDEVDDTLTPDDVTLDFPSLIPL